MARIKILFPLIALVFVLARTGASTQSLSYSSGQNVSPAFEGWEKNDDGSFSFLFGYMNRNWEEELNVPIGPDNNIQPGGPDQGQPTHLLPRRNRFIFRVRVPADFGQKELVWTLTTQGKVEKAYATLRTDYFIDDLVMASETGALGAGSSSPEVRSNKPPVVKIEGEKTRAVKVGQPLALVVSVTDDGIPRRRGGFGGGGAAAAQAGGRGGAAAAQGPGRGDAAAAPVQGAAPAASGAAPGAEPAAGAQGGRGRGRGGDPSAAGQAGQAALAFGRGGAYSPPSRITVGKSTGLHQAWFVYRGAGKVTFDPVQIKTWEDTRAGANSPWAPLWQPPPLPADGKWTTTATFEEPGIYVLRARADDGGLVGDDQLTVNVTR